MPLNVVDANGIILGRGEVYFDRFNASGVKTGERFLGNCQSFELGVEDEVRDKYSSAVATSDLIKSVNVRRTPGISIVLDEFDEYNLSLAFMGDRSDYQQNATAVTNEPIAATSVKKGHWIDLAFRNISSVVLTTVGGGTTYVITTDYLVDTVSGRIYITPGSTIVEGVALEVDYAKTAIAAGALPTVQAGISSFVEGFVRFIGKPASGRVWEIEVWKASLNPDGRVPFIGDDFASFTLTGKVLADTVGHPTEPFWRAYKLS